MTREKTLLLAAALVITMALGVYAYGLNSLSPSAAGVQDLPPPPSGGPGGPGGLDQRLLDQLNLSTEQKEQISALREAEFSASQAYREQLHQARESMQAAIEASTFDETAVRTIASMEGQATTELSVIRARTWSAIYQLLTETQRSKLADLRQQFRPPMR